MLRRANGSSERVPEEPETIVAGELEIQLDARRVTVAGSPVELTTREFDLLVYLASRPNRAFNRQELLERSWRYSFGDTATVTVHVRRLRAKIEPDPSKPVHIETVGLLIALLLGGLLRAGSEQLIAATRQIGEGDLRTRVVQPHAEELAAVARELEAMQSQLEASRAREREVEKARRELVAWISHDLRTPLARIRAIVEALEDKLIRDPDEVGEYYERLRVEAERLGRLIKDLFELNRISAGTTELELERANAADIVSDIVASFAVIADARGISLRARRPRADAVIAVSPTHLERALGNLLDNALRHTGRGGAVDVLLVSRDGEVAVSIDDECGGTDVRLLKQLLADVDAPRVLGRAGRAGLGIAIAKGLVEAQGGRIAVDATGRGCRFTVTLPRLRDGSVEPAPFTLSPWPGSERASSASTGTASRSRR